MQWSRHAQLARGACRSLCRSLCDPDTLEITRHNTSSFCNRSAFRSLHCSHIDRSAEAPPERQQVLQADVDNAFRYCASNVRKFNYEGFLCTLPLDKEERKVALTLQALNIETIQSIDGIREEGLAQIRLQWWVDAIEKAYRGKAPHHPVAIGLQKVLETKKLNQGWLLRLVKTRIEDAKRVSAIADMKQLEDLAEGTHSMLLYLQLEAAGFQSAPADHVASHIGKAMGLTALLRGTMHHAQNRKLFLPMDLMTKHGVPTEELFRGRPSPALADVVFDYACVAKAHLDHAAELAEDQAEVRARMLLPTYPVSLYLEALEAANFDLLHPSLNQPGSFVFPLQRKLFWHWWAPASARMGTASAGGSS